MDRNKNLLIIGAGVYGLVAKEIAESMHCFEKICFLDDYAVKTPNGIDVIGKSSNIEDFAMDFANVIVAIGDAKKRLQMISKIEETPCRLISLVSPRAYIAPTAQIGVGCVIEPMAVVHTGCVLTKGCIVSAGAVINHVSMLCDGVHVDCNATIEGHTLVSAGVKIPAGMVYKRDSVKMEDLFFDKKNWQEKLFNLTVKVPQGGPETINGKEYTFEDGM